MAKLAKVLLGCYRTGDAADPAIYAGAVIAVLSDYPLEVVKAVIDPRNGIPSKSKWLPTIVEIKEACEAETAPIRRRLQRLQQEKRQQALLAGPSEDRANRKTYDQIVAECRAAGLNIGGSRVNAEQVNRELFCKKFGISTEQFEQLPDAVQGGSFERLR